MMHYFNVAVSVVEKLVEAGYPSYFAGGYVRDRLLNYSHNEDIDIATKASPEQVAELFEKTVDIGAQFGVMLVVEEGQSFEVTSFRKDGLYVDGRRPETIEYASAEEDAHRRDFTINALFYDPLTDTVLDYVGGKEDLDAGVIRAVGNPLKRFEEDRLRILRAIRMAARFDFVIDPKTEQALHPFTSTLVSSVAVERIWNEWEKMAAHRGFAKGMSYFVQLGLFNTLLPADADSSRIPLLNQFDKEASLACRLALLLADCNIEELLSFCQHYKVSKRTKLFFQRFVYARTLPLSERLGWVKVYSWPEADEILQVLEALGEGHNHRERIESWEAHIARAIASRPIVPAERFLQEGIKPGKQMGVLINAAEKIAIEEDLQDAEMVIRRLRDQELL